MKIDLMYKEIFRTRIYSTKINMELEHIIAIIIFSLIFIGATFACFSFILGEEQNTRVAPISNPIQNI